MEFKAIVTKRTEGDGMENVPGPTDSKLVIECEQNLKSNNGLISFKPPAMPLRKVSGDLVSARKKVPKFVPIEPYKAAVRPIIPKKKKYTLPSSGVSQSRCRTSSCNSSLSKVSQAASDGSDDLIVECTVNPDGDSARGNKEEINILTESVKKLSLENSELEKELQMQVQINGELRNLLVASVGEDMETRVSCLTEDKLHLAQKLINTAKNLSTHHEQMEWLASQCEVWRSRFLASSVMVEELARWKATLGQKVNEAENIMRRLMDERKQVRKSMLSVHSNLAFLRDNFDLLSKRSALKSSNVLDLSVECAHLSNGLTLRLLNCLPDEHSYATTQSLPRFTDTEKDADHMLKHPHPLNLLNEPDAACNAVVGAAVALHGQLYHQSNPPRISCCAQCTGPIQLV